MTDLEKRIVDHSRASNSLPVLEIEIRGNQGSGKSHVVRKLKEVLDGRIIFDDLKDSESLVMKTNRQIIVIKCEQLL